MANEKNTQDTPVKKIQLSVKQIKEDLKNGLDRKAIAAKYGLNFAAIKTVFAHEKLKGLKVRKSANVEIVDDDPEGKAYVPPTPRAKAEADTQAQPQSQPQSQPQEGVW